MHYSNQDKIQKIYDLLLKKYGLQGWWPLLDVKGNNPSGSGYHPGDYSYPRNENQKFEIIIGSILTQNTSWLQVEKALFNLKKMNALNEKRIKKLSDGKLKEAIKCAGYFNQKAKKIRLFTDFYSSLKGKTPSREELLAIWGIGDETADSILLYGYKVPTFVIDAYTKRIFSHLKIIKESDSYMHIKHLFEKSIPRNLEIYQEYHALIVEHAKQCYSKKPYKGTVLACME